MPKLLKAYQYEKALILLELFLLHAISFTLLRLDVVPGFPGDRLI